MVATLSGAEQKLTGPTMLRPPTHAVMVDKLRLAAQALTSPVIVIVEPTGEIVVTLIGWLKIAELLNVVVPLTTSVLPDPVPLITDVLTVGTVIGDVIGILLSPGHGEIELTTMPLVQNVLGMLPVILPVTLRLPFTFTVPVVEVILSVMTYGVLMPEGINNGTPGVHD